MPTNFTLIPTSANANAATFNNPLLELDAAINSHIANPHNPSHLLNITTYGAVGNDSTDNTTSIQNAINAAAALGGGVVLIPEGIFQADALSLPSLVTLQGIAGGKLKKINQTTGTLLSLAFNQTTGTIAAASPTLSVASATGMYVGQSIFVEMASGGAANQNTTLNGGIDDVVTSLVLTSATGFPDPAGGAGYYLRIDSEILGFTDLTGTTATVTRGALGTTPAAHLNGVTIYFQSVLLTQIAAISGTIITLSNPATVAVTNTLVGFGAFGVKILDVELDGNRQLADVAAPTSSGIGGSGYASYLTVRGCHIHDFQRQGILLAAPWHCKIIDNTIRRCGQRGVGTEQGSHIFMFARPRRNLIRGNHIIDDIGLQGITLDDRSTTAGRIDGEGYNNVIADNILVSYGTMGASIHNGIVVQGSHETLVHHNTVINYLRGIDLNGAQGNPTSIYPDNCIVDHNIVRDCTTGIYAASNTPTNLIDGNIVEGGTTPLNIGTNVARGNVVNGVLQPEMLSADVTQGINVITKTIIKTGFADGVATETFKITTTNETGDVDAGAYVCNVTAIVTHPIVTGSGSVAAKKYRGSFTRAAQATGAGVLTAVEDTLTGASAATNAPARDINTIVMTVAEASEYDVRVSFNIDLTGSAVDTARIVCFVELLYYAYTTAPVITTI